MTAGTRTELADREFIITRSFGAPPERVFRAWTDPAEMARWWGPAGFTTPMCEMDPQPGAYRITMRSPEGVDYPLTGVFREVVAPRRLVMTIDTTEHPPEWHSEMNALRGTPGASYVATVLLTATFEPHGTGTRLTVRNHFPSDADRDAHVEMGMGEGWGQLLDKLEGVLRKG